MSRPAKPVGALVSMQPESFEVLQAVREHEPISKTRLLERLPHLTRVQLAHRLLNLQQQGYLMTERVDGLREAMWSATGREPRRSLGVQAKPEPAPKLPAPPRELFVGVPAAERGAPVGGDWSGPYLPRLPGRPDAHDFRACPSRRATGVVHCYQR